MEDIKRIRVFIASPSDVNQERDYIEQVVKGLNFDGVLIDVKRWENDLPTTSGVKPQELIDTDLLPSCDILIGVFWTKFGSNTGKTDSGTAEEIESFIVNKKPVILYFYDKDIKISKIDTAQIEKINQFKDTYKDNNVYTIINDMDDLKKHISKDIEYNIKKLLKEGAVSINKDLLSLGNSTPKTNDEKQNLGFWERENIAELINEYLSTKQIMPEYQSNLTFYENVQLIKGRDKTFMDSTLTDILNQGRVYAFNHKYGNYDYDMDLRKKFNNWFKPIQNRITEHKGTLDSLSVLGIGANSGKELKEIFGSVKGTKLTVLDLSDVAINKGKKLYKDISFFQGNMENEYPFNEKFDVCLCLRSIQSTGAFRQDTIIHITKHLKEGGIAIISIPNGYLLENDSIIRGLYDYRAKTVLTRRPMSLANKVLNKLKDYGLENSGIITIDTEIVIWGIKEKC